MLMNCLQLILKDTVMKFLKTVIVYGYSDMVIPFSSEEIYSNVRVVKSTSKTLVELEHKPDNVREEDIFGNLLKYTSYVFMKIQEPTDLDPIPF